MWPWLSQPAPLIPLSHLLSRRTCTLSDSPCLHQTPKMPLSSCLAATKPSNHPLAPAPLRSANLCSSRRLRPCLHRRGVTLRSTQAGEGVLRPACGGGSVALAQVSTQLEGADSKEDMACTGSRAGMGERPGAEGELARQALGPLCGKEPLAGSAPSR